MTKPRISLACPSGGVRAAVYFGALKALEEDFEITAIISNSGGSIFGASYLLDVNLNDVVSTQSVLDHLKYLMPKDKLLKRFEGVNIEDLRIPFYIQLTNFDELITETFESGKLKIALEATSHHNFFSPVNINGKNYIDGGVTSGYGIDYLRKKGYKNILAIQTGFPNFEKIEKPFKAWSKWVAAITRMNLVRDLEINPPDYFIDNMASNFSVYDFDKTKEMYDQGYKIIKENLQALLTKFT